MRKLVAIAALILIAIWIALFFELAIATIAHAGEPIPRAAYVWQRDLIREARAVMGLGAPVALFGAQIHQESGWRPDARSAYADGLAQFTPASATWISGAYRELGPAAPFDPRWAMRALVRYDRQLHDGNIGASECDRWAMALAAYNGGQGWINREKRLARAAGVDATKWWGSVELQRARSVAAWRENRDYPRRIIFTLQPRYVGWGAPIDCGAVR